MTKATPRAEYEARLADRRARLPALEARDLNFSRARVGVFVAAIVVVVLGVQGRLQGVGGWAWLAAPALAFVALMVFHDRALTALARGRRAVAHYEAGLARMDDAWIGEAGNGPQSRDFAELQGEHTFADDLDLFGEASLFELLCRARTRAGEETLARWLSPGFGAGEVRPLPSVEVLRGRQAMVEALRGTLDLRESLAVLGEDVRAGVEPARLIHWGRSPARFGPRQRVVVLVLGVVLPILAAAGVALWTAWGPWLLIATVAAEGALHRWLKDTLVWLSGPVERRGAELEILAQVLATFEQAAFEEPGLRALQARLGSESGRPASASIARLRRLLGWYGAQNSGLFFPIALLLCWGPSFALAIERWRRDEGPRIAEWIAALGELEALSSLASHAFENPDDPFPELRASEAEDGPVLEGEALGHPLLPRARCVTNDIGLRAPLRAYVVSGSNMSGKSTFLRTVGVNVVLGLAGAPVRASSMALSPVRVGATLRVQDSLQDGASRFWAELKRLEAVSQLADAGPTLFLLDEILHGTNSHDRRIGAEALLADLLERGAIGLLTTHDLALAQAAEALAPRTANVHFEDTLVDGELVFDYRMRPGVVQKSNALALMRSLGLLPASTPEA
ncbi:DNA mismatch repair protein MutS-like protein [Plesiocystis pacifica SIR-1]|uniref:DNA mismatch repair protein MutS-like protein n=1 Tax=Plesiocystis pacifica SIR-1 TaxID=391625 RepID=A6FWV8_9BACT|nr:DNA mismatch repair protein MutS [Plesiocystis pacifica]EDM81782.1 DNA mismatch repair protein MutS-like protein [Plesiocystis pacifica SIR-1]